MCEKLKGTILGKYTGDLNECEQEAMEDLEEYVDQPLPFPRILQNNLRTILEIELTLKKGTSTPPTVYNKQKVETHMQDFRRLLRTLASERGMSSAHLRSFCAEYQPLSNIFFSDPILQHLGTSREATLPSPNFLPWLRRSPRRRARIWSVASPKTKHRLLLTCWTRHVLRSLAVATLLMTSSCSVE